MQIIVNSTIIDLMPDNKNFWSELKYHIQAKTFNEANMLEWIIGQIPEKLTDDDKKNIEHFVKRIIKMRDKWDEVYFKFEQSSFPTFGKYDE